MNKEIGQRLKDIRLSLGLSQKEMVEGVMDRSSYSRIESGKTLIGISSLLKILYRNLVRRALFCIMRSKTPRPPAFFGRQTFSHLTK